MRTMLSIVAMVVGFQAIWGETGSCSHNIGFAAGFTTGYGLSYRQWMSNGLGVQVTCAPYYSKRDDQVNGTLSLGLTGLKMIKATPNANLFAYVSSHLHYDYTKTDHYYYYPGPVYDGTLRTSVSESSDLYLGAGPGIDLRMGWMTFSFMGGLQYHTDFGNNLYVGPTVECGLYYSF